MNTPANSEFTVKILRDGKYWHVSNILDGGGVCLNSNKKMAKKFSSLNMKDVHHSIAESLEFKSGDVIVTQYVETPEIDKC